MQTKLGIFIVHGMGSQPPDFADATIEKLTTRLISAGVDTGKLCWQTGYWADVIQPAEDKLWDEVSQNNDLSYVKLRQFVISALGDATAYQLVEGEQKGIYQAIHDRIHDDLLKLRTSLGGDFPFLIFAHSLGGHIMSNYIWDRQHGTDAATYGQTSFERMETLAGMVTFGCNIPLFTLAYEKIVSIQFPPKTLPRNLKRVAKWNNYFDPDDILGYPLKPLSASYNKAVTADIEINVGGLLTSWNPMCHDAYWTDDDFLEPVATQIRDVLLV
jgi:hypothetical protein